MSKSVSRIWAGSIAVLVAALVGASVGYVIGLVVTLNAAQQGLRKAVADHAATSDRYPAEALDLLGRMNASPDPRCSEAELTAFRKMILMAHYVKEAGRMRGNQLECSATFSKAQLPDTRYEPDFVGAGKELVYIKVDSLRVGPLTPIVMRVEDSYIALDPYPRDLLAERVLFTISSTRAGAKSPYLGGAHTSIDPAALTKTGFGHNGGFLYATLCSERYYGCNTAFSPIHGVMQEQRGTTRTWAAGGALAGVCFGLTCMSFYRRKRGIEQQLRRAIRRDALRVVYQPLVELGTRKVMGAEALLRWTDEDGLIIPPDIFIKIAEERGFVNQITRLVVRRVLTEFGEYLGEHPEFRLNINVAASDLTDPAFQTMLQDSLWNAEVSPRSLGIEITEGATIKRDEAIRTIAHLRHRGHRVYIDDFGTGYSSLAYLKDLGVDAIKIDRAFTQAIGTESVTVGILPQILAMAVSLKLSVVAEGLETEAHTSYYLRTGLPLTAQGWLFGRPVPAEEFGKLWLEDSMPVVPAKQKNRRQASTSGFPNNPEQKVNPVETLV